MASKFQNRLVGTVILVSLGVILLPSLLDGQKKHYEEQLAAIPLIPKAGDEQEMNVLPPASQSLSPQLVEGVKQEAQIALDNDKNRTAESQLPPKAGVPESLSSIEARENSALENKHVDKNENKAPIEMTKPIEARPLENKIENQKSIDKNKEPEGRAYVVQLGALRNADKVEEIVATLRFSGYRVYTVPSKPVTGGITRVYVGPDISKQKLQSQLSELQKLSGLNGEVRTYTPR